MSAARQITDADYRDACPRCGSPRWVSVSFNGGTTRVPQCVPCGAVHPGVVLSADSGDLHAVQEAPDQT